ncbi:MAG TPA: hypothetical protein ENO24_00615 [Chloroflexi bacterium]|nr:hypothetical protein [Chloroflexota bacterium]
MDPDLEGQDLVQIVDIQLGHLERRLSDHKVTLQVTDEAKRFLAEEGYDPVYGARPLKRVIQRRLQDPLAREMLEGKFGDGDSIKVDVRGGQLIFEKEAVLEPAV